MKDLIISFEVTILDEPDPVPVIVEIRRAEREADLKSQHCPQPCSLPASNEARQALLAGEEVLHRALFDEALLGNELLQGFYESIRISQRLGDGLLLGPGGRNGTWDLHESALVELEASRPLPGQVRCQIPISEVKKEPRR